MSFFFFFIERIHDFDVFIRFRFVLGLLKKITYNLDIKIIQIFGFFRLASSLYSIWRWYAGWCWWQKIKIKKAIFVALSNRNLCNTALHQCDANKLFFFIIIIFFSLPIWAIHFGGFFFFFFSSVTTPSLTTLGWKQKKKKKFILDSNTSVWRFGTKSWCDY